MARKKKETTPEATPATAAQEVQEQPTATLATEATTPLQEAEAEPEAPAPEIIQAPEPEPVPVQEDPALPSEPTPEATPAPEADPEPEPDPAGGRHTPYKATVAVSLAVVHKEVGLGTAEMLKAVGSLRKGTTVTVTGRKGTYAQLKNGLYILEAFLEVLPTD